MEICRYLKWVSLQYNTGTFSLFLLTCRIKIMVCIFISIISSIIFRSNLENNLCFMAFNLLFLSLSVYINHCKLNLELLLISTYVGSC